MEASDLLDKMEAFFLSRTNYPPTVSEAAGTVESWLREQAQEERREQDRAEIMAVVSR